MLYVRDDIYFCTGCRQFHDSKTHEPVIVPDMDYFDDPDTGKRYKVKQPKKTKTNVRRGFGKPTHN